MLNRSMVSSFVTVLSIIAFNGIPAHSTFSSESTELTLWYNQPASEWVEALPIGNGRLGAMVFGGTKTERIQLNEDTIWAGHPLERDRKGAYIYLVEARRLIFKGKYAEGQKIMQDEFMSERISPRSYQTLGDLWIMFKDDKGIEDYRRELNLDTAIAKVIYRQGDALFTREVFSSPVDQAIVIRLTCDKPNYLTFDVNLSRSEHAEVRPNSSDLLIMRGQADQGEQHAGVKFTTRLQAVLDDGTVYADESGLHIKNAGAVTLFLTAATDYRGDDPDSISKRELKAVAKKTYKALREAHIKEHQRLFHRVKFDLGGEDKLDLPVDQRLQLVKEGADDPQLIAMYFQFGRYLLISCSRPGCMASNLQGLWSEHIDAPWNADYHININIQMNYWPAEMCNLSECHEPFFDLIDNLRPRGRKTARDVYGCRGFTAHHTTDAWYWTSPIGNAVYGMWPLGAAWSCQHLWEHYLYTGDIEFLRQRGYPIMKEGAEFFLDFLTEDPQTGKLVSGPSTSPENQFRAKDGVVSYLTMGCAMDQEIVWDLFTNCLDAARVLSIDDEFVQQV